MSHKVTNIAKNTSYFTVALIIQKIISLTYFTIYARELGPADLGQYYFAISITSIFALFLDLGVGNVVTREVAKHPEAAGRYVSSVLALKGWLGLATVAALIIWTQNWEYEELTRQLIYISAGAMVLDGFTSTFYAALRGFHNLKFESIASVCFQLIVLGLSLIIFRLDLGIAWLMGTLVAASLFNFVYASIVSYRTRGISPWPHWNYAVLRPLLIVALPFALFVLFQRFYTYFDSILLFKIVGDRAVGIYQIPFKIMMALQFLPMAFVASLYPALSAYWHKNRDQLAITFERSVNYSLILSIPVAIGAIVLADTIVVLFERDFSEAALPLQVSMIAIPFMFLGYPVGSLLNACDRQKRNMINMAITATVSIALNLILIPQFGVLGACLTTVITSVLMLGLGWTIVPRIIGGGLKLPRLFPRILLAGLLMGAAVYLLEGRIHAIAVVACGGVFYAVFLFMFKAFTLADIKSVYKSFAKQPS